MADRLIHSHRANVTIYDPKLEQSVHVAMNIEIDLDKLARFFAYRLHKNKGGKSRYMSGTLSASKR